MGHKKKQKKKQKAEVPQQAVTPVQSAKQETPPAADPTPRLDEQKAPVAVGGARPESTVRKRAVVLPAFFVAATIVPVCWFMFLRDDDGERSPPQTLSAEEVVYEDFAGAETCEECHEAQYSRWLNSTHAKAGGNPTTELIIARFDGSPIRFADAIVRPIVGPDSSYQFVVDQEGFAAETLTVAGVIGGGHMFGGETQGFVSEYPDGTVRFLPFDFIRHESLWFCNTTTRSNKGWIPITMDMSITECADWPPVRLLGTEDTYANCQECHAALVDLAYDSTANRYSTRITTLAIDCESCHGPMPEHVEKSQPEVLAEDSEIAVDALAILSKDSSLNVCFRCHALKDVMRQGYLPGDPLAE